MSKQRIIGFLVIAALLAIFLPYVQFNNKPMPPTSEVVIPEGKKPRLKRMDDIKKEIDTRFKEASALNQKNALPLQEKAWTLQLASFEDAGKAEFLMQQLKAKGFSAYKQPFLVEDNRTVFRVYVGPLLSLKKAKLLKEQIQKEETFQALEGVILSFRPITTLPPLEGGGWGEGKLL